MLRWYWKGSPASSTFLARTQTWRRLSGSSCSSRLPNKRPTDALCPLQLAGFHGRLDSRVPDRTASRCSSEWSGWSSGKGSPAAHVGSDRLRPLTGDRIMADRGAHTSKRRGDETTLGMVGSRPPSILVRGAWAPDADGKDHCAARAGQSSMSPGRQGQGRPRRRHLLQRTSHPPFNLRRVTRHAHPPQVERSFRTGHRPSVVFAAIRAFWVTQVPEVASRFGKPQSLSSLDVMMWAVTWQHNE